MLFSRTSSVRVLHFLFLGTVYTGMAANAAAQVQTASATSADAGRSLIEQRVTVDARDVVAAIEGAPDGLGLDLVADLLAGSTAETTRLNLGVRAGGSNSITVEPGADIRYEVVGVLSDNANEGLALFGFDLVFDGGDLPHAFIPNGEPTPGSDNPMINFTIPWGITNPDEPCPPSCGFGGTIIDGVLVQVGGGQNTINNVPQNAPYPIGPVLTGVAQPGGCGLAVLVTGTLTAPDAEGEYTLAVENPFANVIKRGETGEPFWAPQAAETEGSTPLTLIVSEDAEHRGKMYWTDSGLGKIQRANLDGSNVEELIKSELPSPHGIAIDAQTRKVYWTDIGLRMVRRANLDGSEIEDLVVIGLEVPVGLAIDPTYRKMYWLDNHLWRLSRADLDGTNVETIAETGPWPQDLDFDPSDGLLYWTEYRGTVRRTDVDGANVETIVQLTGGHRLSGIAVDSERREVYWCDLTAGSIQRANMDGSKITTIVYDEGFPEDVLVDARHGAVYWITLSSKVIRRTARDGGEVEDVVQAGPGIPERIVLDSDEHQIYWTDWLANSIRRLNLDSFEVDDLIAPVIVTASGVAIDPVKNKMYWSEWLPQRIRRANLDGSDIEDIVTGVVAGTPTFDPIARKLYFPTIEAIYRMNLDGSKLELVVTDSASFGRISIDTVAREMYWAEPFADPPRIQRARLDGSNLETLAIDGLGRPFMVVVAPETQDIYWSQLDPRSIRRIGLDGRNSQTVIPDLSVVGLALDPGAEKMYWGRVTSGAGALRGVIERANLDGSGRESLVTTGLRFPHFITLDLRTLVAGYLDIKPGSCPNPVNVRSRGVLPMAIVGSDELDVAMIDHDSLSLARSDGIGTAIEPIARGKNHSGRPGAIDDVTGPFDGGSCECAESVPDGFDDLLLKFSTEDMVRAFELNGEPRAASIALTLSGTLIDGRKFQASDCITVINQPDRHRGLRSRGK